MIVIIYSYKIHLLTIKVAVATAISLIFLWIALHYFAALSHRTPAYTRTVPHNFTKCRSFAAYWHKRDSRIYTLGGF